MSETGIAGSGSTIHGVLVIVAACIGVIGYVIRSRLNTIELKKHELQKLDEERRKEIRMQEEERRRAALAHCKQQLDSFIGPLMALSNGVSNYLRWVLYLNEQHELAEAIKSFRAQEEKTFYAVVGETTLNRLKNSDEEAIKFLIKYRLCYETFNVPAAELLKKYQYSLCEMPTQKEHDEMYPGLKGKTQLTIFDMAIATFTYTGYLMKSWDGKTKYVYSIYINILSLFKYLY